MRPVEAEETSSKTLKIRRSLRRFFRVRASFIGPTPRENPLAPPCAVNRRP